MHWNDARNRNPRKPSPTILSGFIQSFRHSSSAPSVRPIPQIPDEHSQGRTKSVPNFRQVYLARFQSLACTTSYNFIGNEWFKGVQSSFEICLVGNLDVLKSTDNPCIRLEVGIKRYLEPPQGQSRRNRFTCIRVWFPLLDYSAFEMS